MISSSISRCLLGVLLLAVATVDAIVLTPEEGKCKILGFFPTKASPELEVIQESDDGNNVIPPYTRWTPSEVRRISKSMMITAFLAVEHFHNRNSVSIMQQVRSCDGKGSLFDLLLCQPSTLTDCLHFLLLLLSPSHRSSRLSPRTATSS